MKVRVIGGGYYYRRVRDGEEIELRDAKDISLFWQEPIDDEAKKAYKEKEQKDGARAKEAKQQIVNTSKSLDIKEGEVVPGTVRRKGERRGDAVLRADAKAHKEAEEKAKSEKK